MPMLAHFEDLPPQGDRRRSARRALKLGGNGGAQSVTIHDLSLTGALLETTVPMLVGQILQLQLPEAGKIDATIVWNSGEFYGCQFEFPIAPSALSAAILKSTPTTDLPTPDPVAELRALSS